MKKIKYLILLIPFIFIINVNAEECTNLIDFTNSILYDTGFGERTGLTVNSSNSVTISPSRTDGVMSIRNFSISLLPNTSYVLSIDFNSSNSLPSDLNFYLLDNLVTNSGVLSFSNSTYKYTFSTPSSISSTDKLIIRPNSIFPVSLENVYLFKESEYDVCMAALNTPTYTYRFLFDNEVYESDTVEENTVITLPESPTKEGYTFTGWTLNSEEYTGGAITSDIDIIANFEEIVVTPGTSVNVDLTNIYILLVLIAAAIILLIEINFVKSIFKSRR